MYKNRLIAVLAVFFLSSTMICKGEEYQLDKLILGGKYIKESRLKENKDLEENEEKSNLERFFRPSKTPIINDKIEESFYNIYGTDTTNFKIPNKFLKTPEDTIINYFSILREAANPIENSKTGCGSLGDTKAPYPIAYKFLSNSYKEKVSYNNYLKSFENTLHINLIKANQIGSDENRPNIIKYFVEIETIEGTNEQKGVFAYYYGYIYLKKEGEVYKIIDMNYTPENYLCAPYHGWSYDAKAFVEIEYGDWCSLIDGEVNIEEKGYEKKVYFKDKDLNEYYVLFYQLTNGVDIKISDYKKNKDGNWEQVYINPEKCLDKKNN
jgi:hypothetical protein